jgi:hypothetical protein
MPAHPRPLQAVEQVRTMSLNFNERLSSLYASGWIFFVILVFINSVTYYVSFSKVFISDLKVKTLKKWALSVERILSKKLFSYIGSLTNKDNLSWLNSFRAARRTVSADQKKWQKETDSKLNCQMRCNDFTTEDREDDCCNWGFSSVSIPILCQPFKAFSFFRLSRSYETILDETYGQHLESLYYKFVNFGFCGFWGTEPRIFSQINTVCRFLIQFCFLHNSRI